jgi:hypothetical protein
MMIFPWSFGKVVYIAILQTYCIEAQSMTPNYLPVDDKDAWIQPGWK